MHADIGQEKMRNRVRMNKPLQENPQNQMVQSIFNNEHNEYVGNENLSIYVECQVDNHCYDFRNRHQKTLVLQPVQRTRAKDF